MKKIDLVKLRDLHSHVISEEKKIRYFQSSLEYLSFRNAIGNGRVTDEVVKADAKLEILEELQTQLNRLWVAKILSINPILAEMDQTFEEMRGSRDLCHSQLHYFLDLYIKVWEEVYYGDYINRVKELEIDT